jgi:threonine dehydrogenase-like Zn-dependent dehydrogenase
MSEIDLEPKPLPGPDWVRLRPRLCGVCGSDMSMLTNRSSPALMPFTSFPVVPGHEIVADVVEVGASAAGLAQGQRVVVNPLISCQMRGLDPCPSCQRGETGLCTRAAEGDLSPGMLIGFCRDLPGGWSEEMIAHRSQVFPVPDGLSDDVAVLVEPLSVAMHAVIKQPPPPESRVLIIGSGTIGLLVLSALRLLGHTCHVTVLAKHPIQVQTAEKLGADLVLKGGKAGDAAIQVTGAKRYKPLRGRHVYAGGFDWVYDCVGSARSLDDSLRVAGPRGHVILVGCAGQIPHLDCTFIWARELQVTGCYVYACEHTLEGQPHTFDVALRVLAERPDFPVADLVTHRIPLGQWREAMRVNLQHGQYGAIKTVFDPTAGAVAQL